MNEINKPDRCSENDCKNKAYKKDFITPNNYRWVCRTHYYESSYGININEKKRNKFCLECNKPLDKENVSGRCREHNKKPMQENSHWKGSNVKYVGAHKWVKRNNKEPRICKQCGSTKNVQFANISGEYKRDLSDYYMLCAKCHKQFDRDKEYVCPLCKENHALWKCPKNIITKKKELSQSGDVEGYAPQGDRIQSSQDAGLVKDKASPLEHSNGEHPSQSSNIHKDDFVKKSKKRFDRAFKELQGTM